MQQIEKLYGVIPSNNLTKIKGKSIFTAGLARWLIKRGHHIIDIKPDKKNNNYNKTIFVFKETPSLISDLVSFNNDK